jgi:alkylation response protein AidB-like acyl-CoA dehydrogenase
VESDAGLLGRQARVEDGDAGLAHGEIVLDDVRVPAENLIGEEQRAFGYAMGASTARAHGRAQAVGIAQGALDAAARYVHGARAVRQRVAEFQGSSSCSPTWPRASRRRGLLVYSACARLDAGARHEQASAIAKLFAATPRCR